jgi:hypothetical protein
VALTAAPASAAAGDAVLLGGNLDSGAAQTSITGTATYWVLAVSNTGGGSAVYGENVSGLAGVQGRSVDGAGVYGSSTNGYGLVGAVSATGKAPLLLTPSTTVGPPTSGTYSQGAVMVDTYGRQFICVAAGTPGTWVRPGLNAVTPFRVCDTRAGTGTGYSTGIMVGRSNPLTVGIAAVSGVPVPFGATAIALNLTVTGPTASSYVTVYPDGEALPVASSINFVANQTIANGIVAKLGTSSGAIKIYNSAGYVHVIVDITGFFF